MITIHPKSLLTRSLLVIVFASALSSFSTLPGGDSFTIYLNNKLLVQQFVHAKEKTKTISLPQTSSSDVLRVHYSHCGKMGIARNLVIKDQQNKTLNSWKFEDTSDGDKGAMRVSASEIGKLQKAAGGKPLLLTYSAEQLPEGLVLAHIRIEDGAEASLK